jgi:hypothetical protein
MSPQKIKRKLSLGKMTISNLSDEQLNRIHGGVDLTTITVPSISIFTYPYTDCACTNTCESCDCSNTNCYTCQHSPCR